MYKAEHLNINPSLKRAYFQQIWVYNKVELHSREKVTNLSVDISTF